MYKFIFLPQHIVLKKVITGFKKKRKKRAYFIFKLLSQMSESKRAIDIS